MSLESRIISARLRTSVEITLLSEICRQEKTNASFFGLLQPAFSHKPCMKISILRKLQWLPLLILLHYTATKLRGCSISIYDSHDNCTNCITRCRASPVFKARVRLAPVDAKTVDRLLCFFVHTKRLSSIHDKTGKSFLEIWLHQWDDFIRVRLASTYFFTTRIATSEICFKFFCQWKCILCIATFPIHLFAFLLLNKQLSRT